MRYAGRSGAMFSPRTRLYLAIWRDRIIAAPRTGPHGLFQESDWYELARPTDQRFLDGVNAALGTAFTMTDFDQPVSWQQRHEWDCEAFEIRAGGAP